MNPRLQLLVRCPAVAKDKKRSEAKHLFGTMTQLFTRKKSHFTIPLTASVRGDLSPTNMFFYAFPILDQLFFLLYKAQI